MATITCSKEEFERQKKLFLSFYKYVFKHAALCWAIESYGVYNEFICELQYNIERALDKAGGAFLDNYLAKTYDRQVHLLSQVRLRKSLRIRWIKEHINYLETK